VTADEWLRVKELFHAAVDRGPEDRTAFLAAACGGDAALRAEVERLLTAHDDASGFIERSPVAGAAASASAAGPPLTGVVIGRYEVGQLIGSGGMGQVYAAKDRELRRPVAIKFGIGTDEDACARLKREAQHASRLNHPNISTIHEVGTYHDRPFIVMELVDGQPLSELVSGGRLPIEDVVRYGVQIAGALSYAHRSGVTHRDLKSANVLITADGRAKVLDFGLARTLSRDAVKDVSESRDSITAEGLVAGTLSVLAPEILRGEKADERSDIWSLGVLLYEMATGERPFRGATGFELSAAILHEPPVPLPERVPHGLARVIYRCLEKDLRNRYQNAGDVRTALASHADVTVPARRAPRLVSKYKLPIVVAALLGFASYHFLVHRDSAPVAVGASGRPAIAVMHFQHAGAQDSDTAWLAGGVPSMLVTGLAQTRGLEIVSERRLLEALAQSGEASLASLDREQAADVARRAGAGAIVVGTIFRAGSEIRIDAQVEDLANGRVLAARTVRGTDVFALVDQLSSDIRDVVGFGDAPDVRTVATVSSTSLEAYRLYSTGVEAGSNARYRDAEKLLKSAVAIDPGFAEAYLRLAAVAGAMGDKNMHDEYFRLALEHADRLSERHRLFVDMQIALNKKDLPRARRMLDEVLSKYPDLEEAYTMALHLYHSGDPPATDKQKLIEITSAGVAAMPASSHARNAHGYALLAVGRYADAIREFETYARIAPREPNPHDSMGEAYLRMGDAEKAVAVYSHALTVDPTFAPSHNMRAWSLAVLGRYDAALAEPVDQMQLRAVILSRVGRYREAEQVLADGQAQSEARGDVSRSGSLRLVAALLAIERNDHARALRDIPIAVKRFSGLSENLGHVSLVLPRLLSGVAHIQGGRVGQAVAEFEAQGRVYTGKSEIERSWRHSLEAEIALARGDLPKAASAFGASEPQRRVFDPFLVATSVLFNDLPSRDGLARVAIARGDLDEAINRYRGLLRYSPESKWVAPLEPLYVLQIARLLEKKGDRKAALNEYQRFLELWKNADTDLPQLAEAKRVVARLTD
jgi:tetratricopeptide (TPR) repeat protein/predicted Ser/Thr protein kinase